MRNSPSPGSGFTKQTLFILKLIEQKDMRISLTVYLFLFWIRLALCMLKIYEFVSCGTSNLSSISSSCEDLSHVFKMVNLLAVDKRYWLRIQSFCTYMCTTRWSIYPWLHLKWAKSNLKCWMLVHFIYPLFLQMYLYM